MSDKSIAIFHMQNAINIINLFSNLHKYNKYLNDWSYHNRKSENQIRSQHKVRSQVWSQHKVRVKVWSQHKVRDKVPVWSQHKVRDKVPVWSQHKVRVKVWSQHTVAAAAERGNIHSKVPQRQLPKEKRKKQSSFLMVRAN
ncbi:unnamed protein product [Brugia timori]|uniref:Ovule protein n=1 Tax=Brugia timori TaxID=42155 RepID=A0A0R3R297_9BILA|nr:unnamed protein product [Brugia timori]